MAFWAEFDLKSLLPRQLSMFTRCAQFGVLCSLCPTSVSILRRFEKISRNSRFRKILCIKTHNIWPLYWGKINSENATFSWPPPTKCENATFFIPFLWLIRLGDAILCVDILHFFLTVDRTDGRRRPTNFFKFGKALYWGKFSKTRISTFFSKPPQNWHRRRAVVV